MGGCASKPKESDIPETEKTVVESKNVETETVSQVCRTSSLENDRFLSILSMF